MSNQLSRGYGLSPSLQVGPPGPPLADPNGIPYEAVPCSTRPAMWDEDASLTDKRHAAQVCRHACPAMAACWVRRRQLGNAATGVWGGRILRKHGEDRTEALVADDALIVWALAAGVTFYPPHR